MRRDTPTPTDGARPGDSSGNDPPDEGAGDALDRLAELDDRLGGHALNDRQTPGDPDGDAPPEGLDAILLLRQMAAEERGGKWAEEPEPPRRIGRFAIVREVGSGGFARVYEAFDTRLLRRVALKVARPETVLPAGARKRFVREAELAARLVHPHVVTIHEAGDADGHVYIAEEFCPGGNLGEWLERHPGPMPPRVAARLLHTLAGAVAHSHGFCILHRDIKPANVLLVPAEAGPLEADGDAGPGRLDVKLADFGLGKLADQDGVPGGTNELTRVGSRVGTPAWMAPEQIDGALGPVGPAADIHALGLLLDRLLTGRCTHAGSDDAETMRRVLTAEPVPPDRIVPGVPADLAAVTTRCLAKQPLDRYATVADLAADLARFLDGRPTVARPLSPLGRAVRVVRRHRALVTASALALAASVVALAALAYQGHQRRLLADRAAEVRGLQAAATLRRGFESWRTGDVQGALSQLDACRALDPQLAASLAGRWLAARLHGEEAILLGPEGKEAGKPVDLHAVAVSPDGTLVAAGGADGRLAVVEAAAGKPPRFRTPLHDEINDVAFSPDGTLVATAGQDGRVCLCDAADGRVVRSWRPDGGAMFGVVFAPDGASLVCGGASRAIHRLALAGIAPEPATIHPFEGLEPPVALDAEIQALAFVPPDRLAVACGNRVVIAAADTGRVLHELVGHKGSVGHVAASADGRRVVTGGSDRQPRVWDAATGETVADLPLQPSWVAGCHFTADGSAVVVGCRDGVVRVLPVAGGSATPLVGHVGRVWEVAILPDGDVVSVGADGSLRRFDLRRPAELAGVREHALDGGPIATLGVVDGRGPSAGWIVGAGNELLRLDRGARVTATLPVTARYALAMDGARGSLAAVDENYHIAVVPIPGAGGGGRHVPDTWRGQAVAWCGAAGLLVGTADGKLVIWDDRAGRVLPIDDLGRGIDALDVTLGGDPRAVVVAGKTILLYDRAPGGSPRVGSGRPLLELSPTTGTVRVVAFAPDGRSFVIGTNEGGVERFDATTGLPLGTFARHASDIRALAWSPDGRTLVSADTESVRFSDVRTTTVFDDFRPGWRVASARLVVREGGVSDVVVAGNADASDDGRPGGRIAVAALDGG